MALAVDSVSWKPLDTTKGVVPFLAGAGQWVTTPQAALSDKPSAFAKSPVETPESLAHERPAVLTLSDAAITVPLVGRPAGPPPKGETHCAPTPERKELPGVFPVAVGELHRERHWGGEFVYTSTKSSSFQVGSSVDGKHWKVAGSASMSKTRTARSSGYEEPTDHLVFETSWADMKFTQFTWVCGEPYWKDAYTIEPTDWTGGMDDLPGVNLAACNPEFTVPVSAGDKFDRDEGASQTLQAALSVQGFVGAVTTGITGTVEATKTTAKGVGEMWEEQIPREALPLRGDQISGRTHQSGLPALKKLLLLAPVLAVLAVVLVVRDGGAGGGPLDAAPAGHASPMITGEEYDHFSVLLYNRGEHPIDLERIRLTEVAGPVELIEVRGRSVNEELVGGAGGGGLVSLAETHDPPRHPLAENHTLRVPRRYTEDGTTPVQAYQVLFRVKMPEAGVAHSGGVEIDYTSHGKRYRETFEFRSTWCAPAAEYFGPDATKDCDHDIAPEGDGVLG